MSQLCLVRAVGELDERVHHALGVDHGIDLRVRKSIQPFGLDDLERLVDQGRRVDRDLRPHPPGRMGERLVDGHQVERSGIATAERSAAGGQDETRNRAGGFPDQALPDRRVLAVDRAEPLERVAAQLVEQRRYQVTSGDERLLVGERHAPPRAQRPEHGGQRGHAGGRHDNELDTVEGGQLASPPSAQRSGAIARRSASAHHQRADGQAASCSAMGDSPWALASATTSKRSACRPMTSSVWRPIDPVEPRTATPVKSPVRRPAARNRQGRARRTGRSRCDRGSRHVRAPGSRSPCVRQPASASTRPGPRPGRPARPADR